MRRRGGRSGLHRSPLPRTPDGSAELHTQLVVQEGGGGGGGEPFRFGRRFTARSAVMSYSHASAVDPKHSIVYRAGQVQGTGYYNQGDVLVTLFHCWTATTHRIASIAPSNSTLTVASPPEPHVETFLTASMQAGSVS